MCIEETREKYQNEVEMEEYLLNAYLTGFTRMGKFNLTESNQRDYAWLILSSRAFNTLWAGFELLEKGYYHQSAVLSKGVIEDWLTANDCEKTRKTVDAVIKGDYDLGKGEITYNEMVKRAQRTLADGGSAVIRSLGNLAFSHRIPADKPVAMDKKFLRLGQFDDKLFDSSYTLLLTATVNMMDVVRRVIGPGGDAWWKDLGPALEAAQGRLATGRIETGEPETEEEV